MRKKGKIQIFKRIIIQKLNQKEIQRRDGIVVYGLKITYTVLCVRMHVFIFTQNKFSYTKVLLPQRE